MKNSDYSVIEKYFKNWENKKYKKINKLYHNDFIFNDEIYSNLDKSTTTNMWKEFFENNNDSKMFITYNIIHDEKNVYLVDWTVRYYYGKKSNKVENNIISIFDIQDGKIIKQKDNYSFKNWMQQAYNLKFIDNKYFYIFINKLISIKSKIKK